MDAAWWNISHESTFSPVRRFMFIDTTCLSFQDTLNHSFSVSFHFPLWCLTLMSLQVPSWGHLVDSLVFRLPHSWPFKPRKSVLAGYPIRLHTLQVGAPALGGQVLIQ